MKTQNYGATLLLWAIGMEKYDSAEALLKFGANPNIGTSIEGVTPLFLASGYSWIDNDSKQDPKYVELLLSFRADTNINYIGRDDPGNKTVIEPGTSPLMNSIGSGIEKTKALVEAGADIDYKNERGYTAAIQALQAHWVPEYAHYLIAEKKAKVKDPFFLRENYGSENPNDEFLPVDILRYWIYDLNSKEYKMKLDIIQEFKRQGIDYWATEIDEDIINQIKALYPQTWEEYIKSY